MIKYKGRKQILSDNALLKFLQCNTLFGSDYSLPNERFIYHDFSADNIFDVVKTNEAVVKQLSFNMISAHVNTDTPYSFEIFDEKKKIRKFRIIKLENNCDVTRLNATLPKNIRVVKTAKFKSLRHPYRYDIIIDNERYCQLAITEITCFLNLYFYDVSCVGFSNIDIIRRVYNDK